MRRGFGLGLALALGGCELIANIPSPSSTNPPGDARTDAASDADASDAGRGCVTDAECATNVCLPDGACAMDARFVYAAPGGTGTECTLAVPCTLDEAVTHLTPAQDIVKLAPGVYQRVSTLLIDRPGILAGPGATLRAITGAAITTLHVTGAAAAVTLLGLTLEQEPGNSGIQCDNAAGLSLVRATVTGGNTGAYIQACPFTLDRSRMTRSTYYALLLLQTSVEIVNSYIVENVTDTTYAGAAIVATEATGRIVHATIVNNTPAAEGAIRCTNSPQLVLANLVATGNTAGGIDPSCTVTHSIVDAAYAGGANNLAADPLFANPMTGDYHIEAGSPARGHGDPSIAVGGRDGDGENRPRPAATNPDSGADEIP